jgi:hypothetical protein
MSRSQWPHGLRCGSAVAHMLGLRIWIPPGAWMSVSFQCCVLSGRGLCDGLIHRPEMYYWICVCHWVWSGAAISRQKRGQPKKDIKFLGVSPCMHLHLAIQVFKRLTHRKTYMSWVRCEPVRCTGVCYQVKVLNLLCSYFYFMAKIALNATCCTIFQKWHNRKSST